ncbi:MAG: hypothetical protein ACSHXZ_10150 [Gammaproteobacteria bacterium]
MSRLYNLPARPLVGYCCVGFIVLLLLVDYRQAEAINPYDAPAPVALGSGKAPEAAHCTNF